MNKFLIDESPHMLSPHLAAKIGINKALFLQQLHFKCQHSNNREEGRLWFYNTTEQWLKMFPYFTDRMFRNMIKSLKEDGLIITGIYNKNRFDRTTWYTINYEAFEKLNEEINNEWVEEKEADIAKAEEEREKEEIRQEFYDKKCPDVEYHVQEVLSGRKRQIEKVSDNNKVSKTRHEMAEHTKSTLLSNATSKQVSSATSDVVSDAVTIPKDYQRDPKNNNIQLTAQVDTPLKESNVVAAVLNNNNNCYQSSYEEQVGEIKLLAEELKLNSESVLDFSNTWSYSKIKNKLLLLKFAMQKKKIDNPIGWLAMALKNNYDESIIENALKAEAERREYLDKIQQTKEEYMQRQMEEKEKESAEMSKEKVTFSPCSPVYKFLNRQKEKGN